MWWPRRRSGPRRWRPGWPRAGGWIAWPSGPTARTRRASCPTPTPSRPPRPARSTAPPTRSRPSCRRCATSAPSTCCSTARAGRPACGASLTRCGRRSPGRADPTGETMRSIDIHAHVTPQCFWRATENGGAWHTLRREKDAKGGEVAMVGGRRQSLPPRARWTPEERIADMDSLGVDVHVVSPYVGFYNYQLDSGVALATSRETNDEIAGMVRGWPQRFAGLGTLPMQDVKASIDELERCMAQLGLKGVEINDHVNGRTFEEPEFRPFWKAAEQMGAAIFFHQAGETLVAQRSTRYHLPNSIGNLVDRAVTFA